jgi:hypothetical protein
MFNAEMPTWLLSLQILSLFQLLSVVVVLWLMTPLPYVIRLVPRYLYNNLRFSQGMDQTGDAEALWRQYLLWVDVALAWKVGQAECCRRAQDARSSSIRQIINEAISAGPPPTFVTAGIQSFYDLPVSRLRDLADFMGKRHSIADTEKVVGFFLAEKRLIEIDPMEFMGHADRLSDVFQITPFAGQKMTCCKREK